MKKTSLGWLCYEKKIDENGEISIHLEKKKPVLICKFCRKKEFIWSRGTTHRVNHLTSGECPNYDPNLPPPLSNDDRCIKLIVKESHPFCYVESENFREFCEGIGQYRPMSINTLHVKLDDRYDHDADIIKNMIRNILGKGSTYLDMWKSRNGYHFTALIFHYLNENLEPVDILLSFSEIEKSETGENIFEWYVEQLAFWGVRPNQLNSIITDNGPNAVRFGTLVEESRMFEGVCFFRCAPHTIQLVILYALEGINYVEEINGKSISRYPLLESIAKARKISSKYNQSQIFLAEYRQVCEEAGVSALFPHSDVSTRWISTFYLIQVVLKREIQFRTTYSQLAMDFPLSNDDINILIDIFFLLQSFENASKDLEGEKFCYISDLIPIIRGLKEDIEEIDNVPTIDNRRDLTDLGNDFKQQLLTQMNHYFIHYLQLSNSDKALISDPTIALSSKITHNTLPYVALLFDIRYKDCLMLSQDEKKYVALLFYQMVTSQVVDRIPEFEDRVDENVIQNRDDLFSSRPSGSSRRRFSSTPTERPRNMEYNEYIIQIQQDIPPLQWWTDNRVRYPTIYLMVQDILSIMPSQANVERVNSLRGNIVTMRRTQMSVPTISRSVWLRKNWDIVEKQIGRNFNQ